MPELKQDPATLDHRRGFRPADRNLHQYRSTRTDRRIYAGSDCERCELKSFAGKRFSGIEHPWASRLPWPC
jgi:hypothetical protein